MKVHPEDLPIFLHQKQTLKDETAGGLSMELGTERKSLVMLD